MFKILVVDDEECVREVLALMLEGQGYQVSRASNVPLALQLLEQEDYDLVITDLVMAPMSGMDLLKCIKPAYPATEVIMMTAFGSIDSAIEAMRLGAYDYVTKPFQHDQFLIHVWNILEKKKLREEVERPRREFQDQFGLENIIGESKELVTVLDKIKQVAPTESTVLITGETGTGKELVARAIHTLSRRANNPFVSVNCAAFPEHLLESELFGHVKGAFTGAMANRKGLMEEATGGTFFMDEVGTMPANVQVKFLRVLEDRTIRRIGENKTVTVECRILAATNQDLAAAIARREFREDLFYRLNVISIHVPPLRARRGDIPLLARHFIASCAERDGKNVQGIAPEAMRLLMAYEYPGNVRELKHIIEQAITMCTDSVITASVLPPQVRELAQENLGEEEGAIERASADGSQPRLKALETKEQQLIQEAINRNRGNLDQAAKELGISRVTLWRRMKKFNITAK
jgi:two-component system response regulator HydG